MLRPAPALALTLAALAGAVPAIVFAQAGGTPVTPGATTQATTTPSAPRPSRAIGLPNHGRLVNGVQLPASGPGFDTWDFARAAIPNSGAHRWGTDRLVALVERIAAAFHRDHPDAGPLLIADLSRRFGGPFAGEGGSLGHRSHQNGLDADILYPRWDQCLCPPDEPGDVDVELSQALVDRFVAAGAQYVFVGPHLPLTGPRGVVIPLQFHDNHIHVRIYPPRPPAAKRP